MHADIVTGSGRVIAIAPHDRFNFEPARAFGSLIYLLERGEIISPMRMSELYDATRRRLVELNYDPRTDSVIVSGNGALLAALTMAASSIAIELLVNRVRLLIFDAAHDRYVCRTVEL